MAKRRRTKTNLTDLAWNYERKRWRVEPGRLTPAMGEEIELAYRAGYKQSKRDARTKKK